jgi:hypothetical protein
MPCLRITAVSRSVFKLNFMNLIKNYTEKISELEAKRDDAESRGMAGACISYTGEIETYKLVIIDLKKQSLGDRFFLEEIVYAIEIDNDDKVLTLTRDFLSEYVDNLPLTEIEREDYIKNVMGFDEMDYYFKSEKELKYFLKNHNLPDNDLEDFSILDVSTENAL